jgi:hypothetical protein
MTDRNKFEQMLEFLVNEDQAKAKEMFHQIVVEKSREIYESLLSEEFDEDVEEGQKEDEDGMEEAMADDEDDGMEEGMDEETDEGFDMSMEAGAEEDDGMPSLDGDDGMPKLDGADDLEGDMTRDDPQEIVGDMSAAVDDLDSLVAELEDAIAAFDSGNGGEMDGMDGEGDEEPKEQYAFEDETLVREYVEKVGEAYKGGKAAGTSESSGTNTKAIFNKAKYNDMGGTTANIAKGGEGGGNKTSLPGHANAKTDNNGNVNVPGGKAGVKHLKGVSAGHGAEKKGSGDTATNKKSIIGSR